MSRKDNNIKILCGSNPREKSEERMIVMQRKFLEDLGITDKETIDKIIDEILEKQKVNWKQFKIN